MKAALPAVIADFEKTLTPARADFLTTYLARLAVHYPVNRTDAEWKLIFEDFAADLAEIPADIVLEVIRRHRQTSRFYPTIAELFAPAQELLEKRRSHIDRMHRLLKVETDEDRAERERAEAAQRHAEYEAAIARKPHRRLWAKYARHPQLRIRDLRAWDSWIEGAVDIFGYETVERWHEELVNINPNDPLDRLMERARQWKDE